MRNSKRPLNKWERSNCLNWEMFPRRYSAFHAPSSGQKECRTAFAKCVAQDQESIRDLVHSVLHREKGFFREVQSMDLHKSDMITSKRKIQLETHRRTNILSITDRWHRDALYRNSQIAIGWTEEYCQYLDSLMSIDFSYKDQSRDQ